MEPSTVTSLLRGFICRCPRCGRGRIFDGWYTPREQCAECHLVFEPRAGDTWGYTYIGSAGVTALFVFLIFLIHPPQSMTERVIDLILALGLLIGTMPNRKGLALAMEYLVRRRFYPDS